MKFSCRRNRIERKSFSVSTTVVSNYDLINEKDKTKSKKKHGDEIRTDGKLLHHLITIHSGWCQNENTTLKSKSIINPLGNPLLKSDKWYEDSTKLRPWQSFEWCLFEISLKCNASHGSACEYEYAIKHTYTHTKLYSLHRVDWVSDALHHVAYHHTSSYCSTVTHLNRNLSNFTYAPIIRIDI